VSGNNARHLFFCQNREFLLHRKNRAAAGQAEPLPRARRRISTAFLRVEYAKFFLRAQGFSLFYRGKKHIFFQRVSITLTLSVKKSILLEIIFIEVIIYEIQNNQNNSDNSRPYYDGGSILGL